MEKFRANYGEFGTNRANVGSEGLQIGGGSVVMGSVWGRWGYDLGSTMGDNGVGLGSMGL